MSNMSELDLQLKAITNYPELARMLIKSAVMEAAKEVVNLLVQTERACYDNSPELYADILQWALKKGVDNDYIETAFQNKEASTEQYIQRSIEAFDGSPVTFVDI